jgi:hypothetical protein
MVRPAHLALMERVAGAPALVARLAAEPAHPGKPERWS